MKKLITLFIVLSLGSSFFSPLISQDKEQKSKGNEKNYSYIRFNLFDF